MTNLSHVNGVKSAVSDQIHFIKVTIPSSTAKAREVQDKKKKKLHGTDCGERDLFSIKLALEEALVNAIKHGNQLDPAKSVHIEYGVWKDRFEILIQDEGPGFNPADVPDPTAIENLDRPCGRGLMLMRYYMTEVDYNTTGNAVSLKKVFKPTEG